MYFIIFHALWYCRYTVVSIPPKLGNDVKQYWARMLDISMIIYDYYLKIYDEEKQKSLNDSGEWIWEWEYPLKDDEYNLSAGYKGIPMFSMNNKDFCEEIYQCALEGKTYARRGEKGDVVTIIGTSSSSQAIIKNGHCSKMKFVPLQLIHCSAFQHYLYSDPSDPPRVLGSAPLYHMMGFVWSMTSIINGGGPYIFHSQKKYDIGLIAENLLNDIVDVKPSIIPLFPSIYSEIKNLFDENHPRCEIWKKAISACPRKCFRSAGAPISQEIIKWFEDKFNVPLNNEYGSSEAGIMMYKNIFKDPVPGEESYLTKCPWIYFYLRPVDKLNPDEGELFIYDPFSIYGYIGRGKKGEFYDSPVPNMRLDIEHDSLYEDIDGITYYKTNDIWRRSKISGNYSYVARADDILIFQTGIKMNPGPFEITITLECSNIAHCCLLLDDTQYEIICFVEPNWSKIIMDDGKPLDTSINPESLTKAEIKNLKNIAQKQTWDSIMTILMNNVSNLSSWAKQLTINNIFIVDYGKKFPVTDKGTLARRVAKLKYANVLKNFSKYIRGEIDDIEEEVEKIKSEEDEKEKQKEEQNVEEKDKEISETKKGEASNEFESKTKTQEEIDDEIQKAIIIIYESIKEIIPFTPEFDEFNINAPFAMYSIDSLATRKLTNILSKKTKKSFSPSTFFNYGTTLDLAKYITGYDNKLNNTTILKSLNISGKIAIIGMALRLPGAINNAKSLWMTLAKGRDCIMAPVKDRNLHTGYANKPSNLLDDNEHNIPRCGCYDNRGNVAKPSEFDAEFFDCLPEEANYLDPRHRWILETSWEALENSGIPPSSLENTITGVFVGINDDHDYADLMKQNGITPPIATHSTSPSGIVGRLSYFYKLFGPSFTIDTACSTGASALHTACRHLQFGDCDLSIVSGVKYLYSSDEFHRTSVARMTSPRGRCATFDKDADGFAPGEGCVTFILKRYEDAVRDNDNILSVILGTSSGQSGLRQSISAPSSEGQVINMKRALHIAGVNPEDISYVETHGTGTPLGDAIEVNALNQVYGGSHTPEHPLVIGSIKTNIGHVCEAAGLASMAKVILAMQHKYIPKNLHFNTLNPEIDIKSVPIQIATKMIAWENEDKTKPLTAQVSSYGLQGSIVHIILQEYIPENKKEEEKSKDSEEEDLILTISAKTPVALLELCNNYLSILENMEDSEVENIKNLCYTSNIGRQHFDYRISAIGKNASDIYDDLEKKMDEFEEHQTLNPMVSKSKRGITQNLVVYAENTGAIEISSKLYETIDKLIATETIFKESFDKCELEIQKVFGGVSLKKMIEEKKETIEGPVGQAFILSFYYSLQQLLESLLIKENNIRVINGGFGFGEIIGLVQCGGLSLSSALTLIQTESDIEKISSWYEKQEHSKLKKTLYVASLDKEFKNGEILSLDDITTIMQSINNNNNETSSFIEKYGKKSKVMTLYSINEGNIKQEFISGCSNVNVIDFYSETEKSLFEQFVMNQYNNGQNINWKQYNSRSEEENSVHKIELPTYPFQRSTYWPISLKNN